MFCAIKIGQIRIIRFPFWSGILKSQRAEIGLTSIKKNMLEKFKPNTTPIPSRELFFHKFEQAKACSKSYQSHKPCKSNFKG